MFGKVKNKKDFKKDFFVALKTYIMAVNNSRYIHSESFVKLTKEVKGLFKLAKVDYSEIEVELIGTSDARESLKIAMYVMLENSDRCSCKIMRHAMSEFIYFMEVEY